MAHEPQFIYPTYDSNCFHNYWQSTQINMSLYIMLLFSLTRFPENFLKCTFQYAFVLLDVHHIIIWPSESNSSDPTIMSIVIQYLWVSWIINFTKHFGKERKIKHYKLQVQTLLQVLYKKCYYICQKNATII